MLVPRKIIIIKMGRTDFIVHIDVQQNHD